MNDEIKEILDYLQDKDNYIEELGVAYKRIYINNGDLKILLDYITNLQHENERLKELDENYPIEEELAEAYRREEDYKSSCEKAVEITQNLLNTENSDYYKIIFQKQLDILNGRSDE